MTERQAWLYLEKKWSRPKRDSEREYYVQIHSLFDGRCYWLCPSISDLSIEGKIDGGIRFAMLEKIPTKPVRKFQVPIAWGGAPFIWNLKKSGAIARANFCKKQANLLRRKK